MFSLIQTAIENGLDPYQYLTWLPKSANNARTYSTCSWMTDDAFLGEAPVADIF